MQENTIPWIIKIVPAVVGAILALVLSGDIDKEGKILARYLRGEKVKEAIQKARGGK